MVVGLVDGGRRAVQEGLGPATVLHQQTDRFGVGRQVAVPASALDDTEVENVREVVGQGAEVVGGQVVGHARHASRLDLAPRRRILEAGQTPHLVVRRKRQGEGLAHLARRSGEENLLAA